MNFFKLNLDTATIVEDIQRDKYMQPGENSWEALHRRVAFAAFSLPDGFRYLERQRQYEGFRQDFEIELNARRAAPAGRILAGVGTNKNVTLYNCFIAPLLQDSMKTDPAFPGKGIMDALADVAYSMQMGGGVGTDFSPIRPEGALVRRIRAPASGPLAFMDMWDSMCRTVMSAGYRRGAMMATLSCDHPDLLKFIAAKHDPARLRMFNLSILITEAFMTAKANDLEWTLGHWEPPFEENSPITVLDRRMPDNSMRPWYVYARLPARQIWQAIMESTYTYSEPGVIFIDRANKMNNLWYAETLNCCNPCGEQIMSHEDACNLCHVNLSRCIVGTPFTSECYIDYPAIVKVTRLLIRQADNIIDISPLPTAEQAISVQTKRRIGLGITGLANMLMFRRQRYGSPESCLTSSFVMKNIRDTAYRESIEISKESGPFPLFDRDKYLQGEFIKTLPEDIREGIFEHGIRNALLTTIAPTGTVSLAQGDNCSSGLEPVFQARYNRRVLQPDNSFKDYSVEDLGFRVYANVMFDGDMDAVLGTGLLPDYMVTMKDLSTEDHLQIQASLQPFIDNSISKTLNVPKDISFENFVGIYDRNYELDCKSCTTYREVPESGRGSILSDASTTDIVVVAQQPEIIPVPSGQPLERHVLRVRPEILKGSTYRLRWAGLPYPMFLTVNDEVHLDGRHEPFEVFVNSKAVDYAHWVSALTRMISAIMRKGGDFSFIAEELKAVWSARGGEIVGQRYIPSEVALIGLTLERHFKDIGYMSGEEQAHDDDATAPGPTQLAGYAELGRQCSSCGQPTVIRLEGCDRCVSCGWSNCG